MDKRVKTEPALPKEEPLLGPTIKQEPCPIKQEPGESPVKTEPDDDDSKHYNFGLASVPGGNQLVGRVSSGGEELSTQPSTPEPNSQRTRVENHKPPSPMSLPAPLEHKPLQHEGREDAARPSDLRQASRPSLLGKVGVVSPTEQSKLASASTTQKKKEKDDGHGEEATKKKPGRPRKVQDDAAESTKPKGKAKAKPKASSAKPKTKPSPKRKSKTNPKASPKKKSAKQSATHDQEPAASQETKHYSPAKPVKKDKLKKSPSPKPMKAMKAMKAPKASKPKEDDPAIAEKKARNSRKSCAYHKAKTEALNNGLEIEEACELGKKVSWLYLELCVCMCVLTCFASLIAL